GAALLSLVEALSHRGLEAAADIDVLGHDRAVRLLLRLHDDDLRARLELVLVARRDRRDNGVGTDDHLLLTLLVFHGERLAVLAGDLGADEGVGHGAAGLGVPRAVPVGHHAALGRQEDVDRERLDGAVRLRHAGDADEGVVLDVGERGLVEPGDARVVGELDVEGAAVAGLERQRRPVGLFDLATDATGLLRPGGRCARCGDEAQSGRNDGGACNPTHVILPTNPAGGGSPPRPLTNPPPGPAIPALPPVLPFIAGPGAPLRQPSWPTDMTGAQPRSALSGAWTSEHFVPTYGPCSRSEGNTHVDPPREAHHPVHAHHGG